MSKTTVNELFPFVLDIFFFALLHKMRFSRELYHVTIQLYFTPHFPFKTTHLKIFTNLIKAKTKNDMRLFCTMFSFTGSYIILIDCYLIIYAPIRPIFVLFNELYLHKLKPMRSSLFFQWLLKTHKSKLNWKIKNINRILQKSI